MSSSYIVEPENNINKKDDTLIIVVDDDGTISVDQETLKNLIMSKSNANVSVVRVGQAIGDHEKSDLTFTVDPPNLTTTTTKIPTTTSSITTLKTTTTSPQLATTTTTVTSTTTTTSESGLVDPFMEMDPEQLEKLETALQSEQAKQILGENVTAMLDMLTVEEQQNSIRYSIELDHCYTSRTSPSDPAPVDPLPVPNSPDVDKVNILESSIPLQIKQQNQQHQQQQVLVQQHTHLNQDPKIVQNTKLSAKKSVGRPRKASIILPSSNIIKTSPGLSSRSNTTINHESKQQQSSSNLRLSVDDNIDNDNVDDDDNNGDHINNINAINDAQSSISESSESGPSDDDVDFGPPRGLRGQRRVRARGGRKGLTTRGGTMAGRRGRPNKHHMDNDQVKRLNNEMAAAVDAMKTPGRIDNNNSSTDFSIKTNKKIGGIKTMGGSSGNKRKDGDEDDDNNKSINSSFSPSSSSSTMLNEKTHFQTTNQVKANLINANMLKGDMILTKPGQSRNNNQKLLFLQKKSITKPSELKTICSISSGPSKKQTLPITFLKTNVINNKTIEDPNNLLIKNSDELINNKLIDNTDKTEISKTNISNPLPSPSSSSSSSPTINKINKSPIVVNKKDRKKSENELLSIKIDEQKEKEKGRIIDNNKLLDNKKHSVKKEQRKVPVVSTVVLGPALFSTPDIIRRVGSIGEGKSSCDLSDNHGTSNNNTSITDDQLNNSTTPMDLDETMKIITSIKTDLQNINNTNTSTNTNDNNMSSSSSSYVSTTNIINNDHHHHHQNKMQLMDIDDDELPKNNTNDDDDLQSALDPGGIEGEENLFATLMDASKHEDELLAEALLLQEQLDVDLGDPSANPLLSPSVFDSELLNPSLATTLQQSQSSSSATTIDSTIKSPEILKQQQYLLSATPPTTPTPSTITTPLTTTTTTSSSTSRRKEQKEPIQIVRGGRVITLPPIEAPATRSKRSLQMKPESPKPINNKLNETNRIKEDVTINKLTKQPTSSSSLTQLTGQTQKEPVSEMESEMEDDDDDGSQNSDSEDDPNRLWCICKRPHNNRFMICCDICEDWFHGKCVNITKAMGKQMEDQGIEWVCPNCKNKKKSDGPVFNSGVPSPSPSSSSSTKTTKSTLSSNNNKQQQQKSNNNNDSSTPKKQMMNKKLNDSNIQSNQLTPTSSTSTTSTKPAVVVHTQCVVCKKEARNSSIYCSDNCILTFAHKTSGKDNKSGTKSTNDEINSVIVLERKTGKVLSGENAPTLANLDNWLKENPTFEQVLLKNINNVQVGNKTFPTIQVQSGNNNSNSNSNSSSSTNNNNNNKTISNKTTSKNQQVQSPKMIYTKIAGTKQTVLTSSNLNSNKSISITTPSATTTPLPVKNLKQTTIKTVPIQPAVASSTPIKKIEQKASSSASPSSSTPSSSVGGGGSSNTKSKTIFSSGSKRGNGIDQNRLNVRKTLSELLTTRMKETDDLKLSEDEISDIAIKIELEMFKFFRDTGTKYKAKYRSLIFNIKDVKNLTLFRKILDKSLKPDEIIKLSPDEMASQELAEWRSKETQHQLEMIKKNELDLMAQAKSIVVKTHKGEQIIENDGGNNDSTVDPSTSVQDIVSVLNNTDNSNFNDSSINEETTTLDDSKKSTTKIDDTDDKKKKKKQKEYKDSKKNKNTKHRSRDRSRDRRHHHHRHSSHSSHNHHSNNKNKNDKRDKNKDKDKSSSTTTTTTSSAIQKNNKKETGNNNNNTINKSSNSSSSSSSRRRSRSSSSSTRKNNNDKDNNSKKNKSDNEEIIDIINKRATTPLIISTDNKIQELQDVDNNWKHIDEDTTTNTIDDTGNLSDLSDREPTSTVNIKTPDININDEQDNKDNKNINETMMMTVVDDEKISTTIDKLTTSIPMDINQQNYDNIDANVNDDDVNNKSTIWQGVINMSEVAKFYTTAQELNSHTIGLTNDLPNTFDIVGRIIPEIVWDYIAKTKKNGSKEIVILRLMPLNDEEKLSYITLYSYLNKRDRFGVVGKPGKNIKDFYIMPYSIDTKIPPILMPFIGDALKNDRQHLLLGIVVKKKLNITNLTTINNKMLVNKKDASDKTTVTQSTLTTLNKAQIGMSRNNIHIDNTKVSTTTTTIPSSVSSSSSSPLPPLPPSPTQILPPLPPTPLSSSSTITTQPLPPLPPLPPTTTSLDKSIVNDDDEPYSPGGIDHDNDNDSGSSTDLSLNKTKSYTATVKHSTELQRKMDELNRQIEAEKKQIQNISSSILTDVGPTLPGLGLDPPGLNDYEEAYSPSDNSRSFTPPPPSSSAIPSTTTENITKLTQPILDKVSDITIPANLQEILANVKRQETTKIDTYLPSKPGASFLTSSFDTSMLNKKIIDKKIYTPTSSNKDNTSTLRSLSDMDLIKKAEEELAAVAIAEAAATVSTVSSISNNFTTPPPPLPMTLPQLSTALLMSSPPPPLPPLLLPPPSLSLVQNDMQIMTMPADILHQSTTTTTTKIFESEENMNYHESDSMDDTVHEQPRPPGVEDDEFDTFSSSTSSNILINNTLTSEGPPPSLPPPAVLTGVKRKINDDEASPATTATPPKAPRTKSRWGQGPTD